MWPFDDRQIQTSVHAGMASDSIRDRSPPSEIVPPDGFRYWKPRPRLRLVIPGSSSVT
jgi:hypothetical protein